MLSPEIRALIRRHFYADHWKIGTIAQQLQIHPDAVRNALEAPRLEGSQPLRRSQLDPYLAFLRETLEQYPRLRATRLFQMARDRGYPGSVVQLRRAVRRLRPRAARPSSGSKLSPVNKPKWTGRILATCESAAPNALFPAS